MKFHDLLLLLNLASTQKLLPQECLFNAELVILQDQSSGFADIQESIGGHLESVTKKLQDKFPGIRIGLGGFVDKPLVSLGYGKDHGGYEGEDDWCYARYVGLSNDSSIASKSYSSLPSGGGADMWEGQYDGILRAVWDDNMGWSDPSLDWVDNKPILRILAVITDSRMHLPNDAARAVQDWNDQYCTTPWCDGGLINKEYMKQCYQCAEARQAIEDGSADEAQEEAWNEALSLFGPRDWGVLEAHPIEKPAPGEFQRCEKYEYPTADAIEENLIQNKIHSIFVVISDDVADYDAWVWLAADLEKKAQNSVRSRTIVLPSDFSNFEAFLHAINEIADETCADIPTTTEEPTTSTTSTTDSATTTSTTDSTTTTSTTDSTTTTSTTDSTTTTSTTDSTTTTSTTSTEDSTTTTSTTSTEDSTTTTSTTSTDIDYTTETSTSDDDIGIVEEDSQSSRTGLVAGASVGGVAAVGAVAVGLVKAGLGTLRRDTGDNDAQVEVPEEPVQREVESSITPDMFS